MLAVANQVFRQHGIGMEKQQPVTGLRPQRLCPVADHDPFRTTPRAHLPPEAIAQVSSVDPPSEMMTSPVPPPTDFSVAASCAAAFRVGMTTDMLGDCCI